MAAACLFIAGTALNSWNLSWFLVWNIVGFVQQIVQSETTKQLTADVLNNEILPDFSGFSNFSHKRTKVFIKTNKRNLQVTFLLVIYLSNAHNDQL